MIHIQLKPTLNFDFGSFPGLAICGTIYSCAAGQWQPATAHSQPCNRKGKNLIHLQPFCLSWEGLSEEVTFEPRFDDLTTGWRIEYGEAIGGREAR